VPAAECCITKNGAKMNAVATTIEKHKKRILISHFLAGKCKLSD
jgi:hypothetical protein